MGIILDIIIIAICAFIVYRSYKKGVIKMALSLASGVVSFIVAKSFSGVFKDFLYDKFVLNSVSDGIEDSLMSMAESEDGVFNLAKMFEDMPDALKQIIDKFNVSGDKLGELCSGKTEAGAEVVEEVAEYIASPLATTISNVLAFAILFIGTFILFTLATFIIDKVFKLPILNGINKTLGIVVGVLKAVVFVFVAAVLLSLVATIFGNIDGFILNDLIESSLLMKLFYSISIF